MRQEGFMRKKLLWKDFVLLAGTILAAAALVVLPTYPVLRWKGEVVFQIGKFAGILIGYILLLLGVWLPEIPVLSGRGKRKYILQGAGGVCILSGIGLLCGFLFQNEQQLHEELAGYGFVILWPVAHGVAQCMLCRRVKNVFVRCIPVYICVLELLFTVYVYFDPLDLFSGWDELGALFTAVLTVPPTGAVLLAWLIWWVESAVRRRKQITE